MRIFIKMPEESILVHIKALLMEDFFLLFLVKIILMDLR
jgi:hypothetical protein